VVRKNLISLTTDHRPLTTKKNMFKALFLIFGIGVVLLYSLSSLFGWEFANSGRNSRLGTPFFYGGGFRGGK
jgi:hypothetical protein